MASRYACPGTFGETIVLRDKAVKHYVSPITPKVPGQAYRDAIVITFEVVTP